MEMEPGRTGNKPEITGPEIRLFRCFGNFILGHPVEHEKSYQDVATAGNEHFISTQRSSLSNFYYDLADYLD